MSESNQEQNEQDDREPMPVFTAGERFKEKVYAIGDITLFRPMSLLEIMVGMPICALICYLIVYPLTNGTWALSIFIVMVYFSPRLLVWIEAQIGRPLFAEFVATVRYVLTKLTGRNLYHGMQRVDRKSYNSQYKALKKMLADERTAHDELMETKKDHTRG